MVLEMRKMKDSGIEWIGEIPEGWRTINPKALFTQRKDKAQKGERQLTSSQQYGILYQDDYMELTGSKVVTVEKDFDILKHVEAGDFVISMRSFQGGLEYSTKPGAISSAYIMLVPNLELVYPRFYRWLLKSSVYIDALQRTTNMVRDGQAMRYSNFAQVRLFTLPLDEQKSRADFLDLECSSIDKILFKTRSSIEEYKKLKQAVITQAVTKGVRGEREMKDSGVEWIGEIPKEWDILNLVAHTSMLTPMRDRPENLDGPIPWIRIEDFDGKYISSSKASLGVSKETVRSMNLKIYPVGTILCTSSCIMGKCAIVSRELVSNQRFIGIIPDQNTCENFLYYLMLSNSERMNYLATGALQANLSRSSFEHLKVQFPSYQEQKEISDYLDTKCAEIDKLIAKKEQLVKELESYKKSLIYEVVTGKREV
jgi:type I restriction enzyme S subunit